MRNESTKKNVYNIKQMEVALIFFSVISGIESFNLLSNKNQIGGVIEDYLDRRIEDLNGDELLDYLMDKIELSKQEISVFRDQIETSNTVNYRYLKLLKNKGKLTEEQANKLVDWSIEKKKYPLLFRSHPTINVLNNQYSINLLWFHKKKLDTDKGHMFGYDMNKLEKYVIYPISQWRIKQENAIINFYYDGMTISKEQLKNTEQLLKNYKVNFKNIRDTYYYQKDPTFMDFDQVFLKVDIAKIVILLQETVYERKKYAIFTDVDVVPIIKEQLFDNYTINLLNDVGYLLGYGTMSDENSYHMLFNNNERLKIKVNGYEDEKPMNNVERIEYLLDKNLGIIKKFEITSDQDFFNRFHNQNTGYTHKIMFNNFVYKQRTGKESEMLAVKPMIFPRTKFSGAGNGYFENIIQYLKTQLANPEDV